MPTRRTFLKTSLVGLSAFLLPRSARRAVAGERPPVLVALYLRGGADGLHLVVPAGDPVYYTSRPTIQVPPGSELPLDGFFGLNPALTPLAPLYADGTLAFLHATGSPDPSRSHFDCQDFMERATPGDRSRVDGWLARYLAVAGGGKSIAGITLRNARAKSLVGPAPSLAFASLGAFALAGSHVDDRRAVLDERYAVVTDPNPNAAARALRESATLALDALDLLAGVDRTTAVAYPPSELGNACKDAAALIKADIGVRAIALDLGGWDHHTDTILRTEDVGGDLAASLAAFMTDLGAAASTTLVLAMTEFGRRVAENGGRGSDHGHGGVMLAVGGGIRGGRVLVADGKWPGLATDQLYRGQDLAVTTDFRSVYAEALERHLLVARGDVATILPGYTVDAADFPGLYG